MKKKAFMAVIAISGLLLSLVGMQLVEVAIANPNARFVSIKPPNDAKPPIITVSSPQSDPLYSSANFTFQFSVTSPETDWHMRVEEVYYTTDWLSEATPVRYISFDEGMSTSVEPTRPPFPEDPTPPNSINFSCTLSNVTQGNHQIQIHAWCEFYNNTGGYQLYYSLNSTANIFFKTSDSISPSLTPSQSPFPTPTPSPIPSPSPTLQLSLEQSPTPKTIGIGDPVYVPLLELAGIVIVIAAVGALVHFKKRQK